MNQTRVYRSLDSVVDGLGLLDGDRARIIEELGQLGTGQEALRKVFPILRRLRRETRNPQLVETLAKRFAAYVGNGLFRSREDVDDLVKARADKEKLRPPGGFHPIPGSTVWFKPEMISGKPKAYWHPGEGVAKDAPATVKDLAAREVVRIQQERESNRRSMSSDPSQGLGEGLRRLVGMHPAHYKEVVLEAQRHARGVIAEKERAKEAPKPKPAPPKAAAPAAQQKAPAAPQAPPAAPGAQVPQVAPAAKPGAAPPPQGAPGSDPNKPPPGFSPIPNSAKGGWHQKTATGYIYWYPGVGITRQSQEAGAPAPGGQQAPPGAQPKPQAQQPGQPPMQGQQPQVPGQRPGQPQVPGQQQQPQGQPQPDQQPPTPDEARGGMGEEEFKGLSPHEQAAKTARIGDVQGEMAAYAPMQPYQASTHAEIRMEMAKHLHQLVGDGVLMPGDVPMVTGAMDRMIKAAQAAGVGAEQTAQLISGNVAKIVHQDVKSAERVLSDHGIRHVTVNIKTGHQVLDSLKAGGIEITPKQYLQLSQIMVDHDLGYTIPAIHSGAAQDSYHPHASRKLWEQQADMGNVFGQADWAKMGEHIESHSGSALDWEGDPVGSAVRMADNTHLFADKLPEVLFDDKKGVELLAKIALLKESLGLGQGKAGMRASGSSAEFKQGIEKLRGALKDHIDQRSDIPPRYRTAFQKSVGEISGASDYFIANRLAGRNPSFDFDKAAKCMDVRVEQSGVRKAIMDVFGEDAADKQFVKMLASFGIGEDKLKKLKDPPPAISLDVPQDSPQATFTWSPSAGGTGEGSKREKEYADALKATKQEWQSIQRTGDEGKRKAKMDAWLGQLTKALRGLTS